MKWIGLTGGIASGKSTVAKIIRDMGYPVVDADSLSRQVVLPQSRGWQLVIQNFGPEILLPDQSLNRSKLGEIVFNNLEKKELLEKLLHPLIQEEKQKEKSQLEGQGIELAFYDVPLLFEKNLAKDFDKTVLVYCSPELQIERLMHRGSLTREQALQRLQSQIPIDEKIKLSDYVIFNQSSIGELKTHVEAVVRELHQV